MTLKTRMRIAVLAMICTAISVGSAQAAGPQALSASDAQAYSQAFAATERGDFIEAQMSSSGIKDTSLLGLLSFQQLMHPSAHTATFAELNAWLSKYADLPWADRVFNLAARRKPTGAAAPKAPLLAGIDWQGLSDSAQQWINRLPGSRGQAARQAFYAGDVKRALALAPGAGDEWIAGLSAYRLGNYALAESYFDKVADDGREDPWLRAGGGYWAARSATALGDRAKAAAHLRDAAAFPDTFYGMIAERQGRLQTAALNADPGGARQGDIVLAAYSGPTVEITRFVKLDPRAHRAAALSQIGRPTESNQELRAGLALARTPQERQLWTSLVLALNPQAARGAPPVTRTASAADYPTPPLEPRSGFTLDKALVYAIVRQESRFNPLALSRAGAVGLMQLMPEAAARAAGDDKLKADMKPLLDPAFNLRVGQDYVTWLMERGVGYDILRAVAAYNGGPGMLQKTAQQLGGDPDSLLVIECLPALETRNYVEKVMAAYWTYRNMFGQQNKTLDALAGGAKFIDARLDR
ncbi:lytic transglycosylase domain-containing protein [Phenylobacterium sp.]|uniref:lytic transglycosylase domain-containing protein n=1 Tax=Phenylobacterium sp. TaxID=1871053 RepID=UPI002F41451C